VIISNDQVWLMQINKTTKRSSRGFTLIEVMLVVVLIGIMASVVQMTRGSDQAEQRLQHESARFAGIFDVAAEYSMLNNIELGLQMDKTSYQFVGYDGVRWSQLPDNKMLSSHTLPEGLEMTLKLDDLPLDEPALFDVDSFSEQEEHDNQDEDEEKIIPQIYILSGGDITPFSLSFHYDIELSFDRDISYRVLGLYTTPLTIEGPLFDEPR
jgi:general secretion pathway protein H